MVGTSNLEKIEFELNKNHITVDAFDLIFNQYFMLFYRYC